MDDRRASPRIATNIEIVFRETGSFVRSYMLNVSNGGVFVKTDHPLPLDTLLLLRIQLPGDSEKMDIRGKVVWTNPSSKSFPAGMGVQFTDVSTEHRNKINEFVQAHLDQIKKRAIL